jgi:hypothetical protein
MRERNLLYYPCASFTNMQLPLSTVAALYFDELIILDPVGPNRATVPEEDREGNVTIQRAKGY